LWDNFGVFYPCCGHQKRCGDSIWMCFDIKRGGRNDLNLGEKNKNKKNKLFYIICDLFLFLYKKY
jgi:hypothetical protein